MSVFNLGQLPSVLGGDVAKIFESLFFLTPADLGRKDIWFLPRLPVRNMVRSPMVWVLRVEKTTSSESCQIRTSGTDCNENRRVKVCWRG